MAQEEYNALQKCFDEVVNKRHGEKLRTWLQNFP